MYWDDVSQFLTHNSVTTKQIAPIPPNWNISFIGKIGIRGILLVVLLIFLLGQRAYVVYGHSMEPAIHTNQSIIAEKVSYLLNPPQRGHVVIIDRGQGKSRLLKRIVGLARETISIRDGRVYINGRLLNEPYLPSPLLQANYGPETIPAGYIFVLGDNRDNSNDSRYFGPVKISQIIGRAWVSYWPIDALGFIH